MVVVSRRIGGKLAASGRSGSAGRALVARRVEMNLR